MDLALQDYQAIKRWVRGQKDAAQGRIWRRPAPPLKPYLLSQYCVRETAQTYLPYHTAVFLWAPSEAEALEEARHDWLADMPPSQGYRDHHITIMALDLEDFYDDEEPDTR